MFDRLRQRLRDAGTLKSLCEAAEAHARRAGETQPGAEHFVLAALDLPDGSARRAFGRLGVDGSSFAVAIEAQHREALAAIGLGPQAWPDPPPHAPGAPATGLYRAQPSGQALLQALAARQRADDGPLRGADVLAAAAQAQQGITARALRSMGIAAAALRDAADGETAASQAS